jgi:ABC-type transport system involved in multi-copper enzyme maturation permease subunit
MTWMAWRQFRGQAIIALAVLVLFSAYLVIAGIMIRHAYNTDVLGCLASNGCRREAAEDRFLREHTVAVVIPGLLLLVLPGVIGVFWGAPLVAREYEAGTQRLAWTQSVSRRRWLLVKLAVVGAAAVLLVGVLSLLMTWAASRFDQVLGLRFSTLLFGARNVVPLGYAAFAVAAGTVVGVLLRRTVPAMGLTLLVLAAVMFTVPLAVRMHLRAPVTASIAYTRDVRDGPGGGGLSIGPDRPVEIDEYTVPDALMLTSRTDLLDASGKPVYAKDVRDCLAQAPLAAADGDQGPDRLEQCLISHNLHFVVKYQPASRYWSFQWIELSGYLVLSALLVGVAYWRIRRVHG